MVPKFSEDKIYLLVLYLELFDLICFFFNVLLLVIIIILFT
jgi:hypothetical protein